jgi:hypothetical protein
MKNHGPFTAIVALGCVLSACNAIPEDTNQREKVPQALVGENDPPPAANKQDCIDNCMDKGKTQAACKAACRDPGGTCTQKETPESRDRYDTCVAAQDWVYVGCVTNPFGAACEIWPFYCCSALRDEGVAGCGSPTDCVF